MLFTAQKRIMYPYFYNVIKLTASEFNVGHCSGGQVSMDRVYNFSAGPSTLPVEVLEEAAADMLDRKSVV